MVKSQIFTTLWWKVRFSPRHGEKSDLHPAMVKIQIYMTFTPYNSENLDLHNIYIMPWWKVRFTPRHGENSDLHDIYTIP